jgi:hypothetical protein
VDQKLGEVAEGIRIKDLMKHEYLIRRDFSFIEKLCIFYKNEN